MPSSNEWASRVGRCGKLAASATTPSAVDPDVVHVQGWQQVQGVAVPQVLPCKIGPQEQAYTDKHFLPHHHVIM